MDLESASGNRVAFERCRAVGQSNAVASPACRPAWRWTTTTSWALGSPGSDSSARAREALQPALALAESHRLNAWYFKIEQALESSRAGRETAVEQRASEPQRGACDP